MVTAVTVSNAYKKKKKRTHSVRFSRRQRAFFIRARRRIVYVSTIGIVRNNNNNNSDENRTAAERYTRQGVYHHTSSSPIRALYTIDTNFMSRIYIYCAGKKLSRFDSYVGRGKRRNGRENRKRRYCATDNWKSRISRIRTEFYIIATGRSIYIYTYTFFF